MKQQRTYSTLEHVEVTLEKHDLEKLARTLAEVPPEMNCTDVCVDDGYDADRCGDIVKKREPSVEVTFRRSVPTPGVPK